MDKTAPKRMTFELFREIVHQATDKTPSRLYFGKDYAIALDMVRAVANISQNGEPMRIDDMRIVILNLIPHHVSVGTLVFIGSETILQVKRKTDDFNLEGIAITDDLLKVIMHGSIPAPLDQRIQAYTFRPDEQQLRHFDRLLHLASDISNSYQEESAIALDLLSALFHLYEYIYKSCQHYGATEK